MTYFEGWAFDLNEELMKENKEIFEKTKYDDLRLYHKFPKKGRIEFEGTLKDGSKLTERELFLLSDDGHCGFGGYCTRVRNHFYGEYRTE